MTKLSSNRNFPGETFSLKFLLDKAVRIRAFRRRELRGAALSMAFLGGGDLMSFERIGRYEIDLDAFRTIDQKLGALFGDLSGHHRRFSKRLCFSPSAGGDVVDV